MKVINAQPLLRLQCRDNKLLSIFLRDNAVEFNLNDTDNEEIISVLLTDEESSKVASYLDAAYLSAKRINQDIKSLLFVDHNHTLTFSYDNYGEPFDEGVLISLDTMGSDKYQVLGSSYCFVSRKDIKDLHSFIESLISNR